jgi:hypothetical protein
MIAGGKVTARGFTDGNKARSCYVHEVKQFESGDFGSDDRVQLWENSSVVLEEGGDEGGQGYL